VAAILGTGARDRSLTPPVYVCVRKTLDWDDEDVVRARLLPRMRAKVAVWDATLDPPYHRFRARLKRIAQVSLRAVAHAVPAPLGDAPAGAVVIPVDDDDWLAPDLADRVAERYDPRAMGYLWRRAVIEAPRPVRLRVWYWLWSWKASSCNTNDYAVPYDPGVVEVIRTSTVAGAYFDAHAERITRIRLTLAIQNRNVSSQTAMGWRRPTITPEELVASVHRHRTLYASRVLPDELVWARPYVAAMDELMREIRVR